MQCFELTLRGFDGNTDVTDNLVKWVVAPHKRAVDMFVIRTGLAKHLDGDVEALDRLLDYDDGVDLKLDTEGNVLPGGVDYHQWPLQSQAFAKRMASAYEDGVCPDCSEPISDFTVDGEECQNCGHVFYAEVQVDQ